MIRVRIKYKKGEALKYTGHLDLHKVWERTIRRAQLPLAYSKGFHPQPRIQQACPLPLGFTSTGEFTDIWLTDDLSAESTLISLNPALQPGIEIVELNIVPLDDPPLQTVVCAADYFIQLDNEIDLKLITDKVNQLLVEKSIFRERRGKTYDLRGLIQELKTVGAPEKGICMRLSTLPGATGRPEEVLDVLGIDINSVQVSRVGITFSNN